MSLKSASGPATGTSPASTSVSPGRRRYVIALVLGLVVCLGYMDRVNFSVAGDEVIKAFGLSTGEFGLATSIFNWAYVVVLIPVGIIADRRGARLVLALSVIVWSLGALFTGLAVGMGTLIVARLLLGAGESSTFPAGNLAVREWAPAKERGIFTGTLNAGTVVGPAVGAVVAAYLVVELGWRGSFLVEGGAGLLVGVIWYLAYNSPERTRWLRPGERAMILAEREGAATAEEKPPTAAMSIGGLLRTRTVWGLMITQGCGVYTSYLFLSFLPLYLVTERHLKILSSGWVTGLTYGIAAVGSVIAARISDRALRKAEVRRGGRRKAVACVMLLTLPLLALPWITSTAGVIALISWVLIMDTAAITLNWALTSDLIVDKASSGRAFALTGVGGNVFGLLAPIVTGYLVDWTGSYTVPFLVAGGLLLVGAGVTWTMSKRPLQPAQAAGR
ncbi:MFS transporter [Streptomyces sulfonofaciens]|uniref:MFS transporter n=1 Tax=Streptomyces sulfonofaciens TaxID=68272 RepID=A0A919FUV2_9ACTN|nr:MFS transporter [Streptomyces sulfonofaciens]GHH72483.1 MFS transporter [Streptomyces sulfonofaciens]